MRGALRGPGGPHAHRIVAAASVAPPARHWRPNAPPGVDSPDGFWDETPRGEPMELETPMFSADGWRSAALAVALTGKEAVVV